MMILAEDLEGPLGHQLQSTEISLDFLQYSPLKPSWAWRKILEGKGQEG